MRRFASNSSRINAAMIFGASGRTSAAASLSSHSLLGVGTTSAPLFSRSASLAAPTTARLFARTSATPFNLAGKPIQHRFASTATEGAAAAGRTRSRLAVVGVVVAAVGGVTGVVFAAEGDNTGEQGSFFANLKAKLSASKDKLLNIDSNKKALPDAHPPPYGKPITVIIADEVLCVQEYQPLSGGMLTKKRPGVEFFLAQLGQEYEVVIWSGQPITSFGPVIEKLDPNHHALHRLYVDATVLNEDGLNVKDLKLINRPLDKTIVLDVKSENVVQKENLVLTPKYDGRLEDVYLLELLNFFRLLAASSKSQSGVPDVRNWVAAVNKNGPAYFKQLYAEAVRKAKERAAQEMQQRQATQATRERW